MQETPVQFLGGDIICMCFIWVEGDIQGLLLNTSLLYKHQDGRGFVLFTVNCYCL